MKREKALIYIRNQIKAARVGWKISKRELSRRTGISVYLITKIERGENVDMHLILRLLPALYLRSEILIEVGLIESFDDYYNDERVQFIELDRPGGIFAGMNPCPCGYLGHFNNKCRCTPDNIARYKAKISGPLLDRIDMHIEVPALKQEELTATIASENSITIKARVENARNKQLVRQGKANTALGTKEIEQYCQLDEAGQHLLKAAITKMSLSARAYHRILKLARTIADVANEANIQPTHVAEALQYRQQ